MKEKNNDRKEKRNLIIVRAGKNSKHDMWIREYKKKGGWDLAISIYDKRMKDYTTNSPAVRFIHYHEGGKWDGIYHFIKKHIEEMHKYEYIWIPDDDIEIEFMDIKKIFCLVKKYNLELSQPSLLPDSYYSHRITLQNPKFMLRYTNFVELMAPVFSVKILEKVYPLFRGKCLGLGLDWVWHAYTSDPKNKVAILDEVAIGHYRQLGKHLRTRMHEKGIDAEKEKKDTMNILGAKRIIPRCHQAILKDGKKIKSRILITLHAMYGYIKISRKIKYNPPSIRDYINIAVSHIFYVDKG